MSSIWTVNKSHVFSFPQAPLTKSGSLANLGSDTCTRQAEQANTLSRSTISLFRSFSLPQSMSESKISSSSAKGPMGKENGASSILHGGVSKLSSQTDLFADLLSLPSATLNLGPPLPAASTMSESDRGSVRLTSGRQTPESLPLANCLRMALLFETTSCQELQHPDKEIRILFTSSSETKYTMDDESSSTLSAGKRRRSESVGVLRLTSPDMLRYFAVLPPSSGGLSSRSV
eukprot:764224-Hanusia_phi.AAC.3